MVFLIPLWFLFFYLFRYFYLIYSTAMHFGIEKGEESIAKVIKQSQEETWSCVCKQTDIV